MLQVRASFTRALVSHICIRVYTVSVLRLAHV